MCGYLEHYVSATEKVQKVQAKEYEKILKVSSSPAKVILSRYYIS